MCISLSVYVFLVELVVRNLPEVYVGKLLPFLAERLESSPHLQFYLHWCRTALTAHGQRLKANAPSLLAPLRDLQRSVIQKQSELGKL